MIRRTQHIVMLTGVAMLFGPMGNSPLEAQYKLPPQKVVDIVEAPPTPMASLSPDGDLLLLASYDALPSIEELSRPILRLAGTRIDPQTNARQRTTVFTGLRVLNIESGSTVRLQLPEPPAVTSFRWSPDGSRIAFTREGPGGIEIWTADPASGRTRVVSSGRINATVGAGYEWLSGSDALLCTLVVEDRGKPPVRSRVPSGPVIQETQGRYAPGRTYQDLLTDQHDEALFDYYMTAQVAIVDLESGQTLKVGKPGIYSSVEPSPDGAYLLVSRVKKPYSYFVPYRAFPRSVEVWDRAGKFVREIADLPLADEVPIQGVPTGPRNVRWRPLKPATLVWVEALDEGDPKKEVPHRDRLMMLEAPSADPVEVLRLEERSRGMDWLSSGSLGLVTEYDRDRRWMTTHLVDFNNPQDSRVVLDISVNDRYGDPGNPVSITTERGENVVLQEGPWIYLSGSGATPEGDRPVLQRMNLENLQTEELFRSSGDSYETFVDFLGEDRSSIITRYETSSQPPNYFLRDLDSSTKRQLTDFKDPAPELTQVRKELIKYTREDGVPLSGTLYLPIGYKEGDRVPVLIWAYPLEYSDTSTAGQVRSSPNRFTWMRGASHLFLVMNGYAVLDGAQMPIVGDPDTVNDTFVRQIVQSAEAAIRKLDEMGVADPSRVAVGGHSYGAFMTANLLAHSDLFRAGIARSGAYNRSLTPFGFQSEPRTFWQAPEVYFKVSPFMHADKINEPILMIHGEMDNNSGTFPIQSERLYHALQGLGATARLVMLPYESHGYRARESVLHTLAEMFDWLDRFVKGSD